MNDKKPLDAAKKFVASRSDVLIGIGVVVAIVLLIVAIVVTVQSSGPKVVNKPAKACDLLTPNEAYDLLGDKIENIKSNTPTVTGNVANSQCAYSDKNPDEALMKVAAIQVTTGVNDAGVSKIKSVFATSKAKPGVTVVDGLGDSAFFDPAIGQLNILEGYKWIKLSYGVGTSPETNTIEDAKSIAAKALNQ